MGSGPGSNEETGLALGTNHGDLFTLRIVPVGGRRVRRFGGGHVPGTPLLTDPGDGFVSIHTLSEGFPTNHFRLYRAHQGGAGALDKLAKTNAV